MTVPWLISVPVWGERYLRVFEQATLPALRKAMTPIPGAKLVLHSDPESAERLFRVTRGLDVSIYGVPPGDRSFGSLSEAHRQVLNHFAQPGWRVVLLTADLVISSGALEACAEHFRRDKRLVCAMGMRVCDDEMPPGPMNGPDLLAWGWARRHPMTQESIWPDGTSYDVWRMYFQKDGNAICRLCLPHPLALVKGSHKINFQPTVDVNVITNYALAEMHLVTEPEELGMIELSPHDKEFVRTETMRWRFDNWGAPSIPSLIPITNRRHQHLWSKAIRIVGNGNCGDEEMVRRMLAR